MRSILLYLALVGLPILGVLAILRLGEEIEAPPHLGGVWSASLAPAAQLVPPCVELAHDSTVFRIAQSGIHVSIVLNDAARTRIESRLVADRLWGRNERLPTLGTARNACPDASLELAAEVVAHGRDSILVGHLWAGGCAACEPVSFRARRPESGL